MDYQMMQVTIKGNCPMLMHKDTLANPLDPATKKHKDLTAGAKRTEATEMAIQKSEFMAGLYIDADGPYLPGNNLHAAIHAASKAFKLGVKVNAALMIAEDRARLEYEGPRDAEGLYADRRFVDVRGIRLTGNKRLMRCRPVFNDWKASFTIAFFPDQISKAQIEKCLHHAGRIVGIGDYRPRFGRFSVTVEA